MMFANRIDAGRKLGDLLARHRAVDTVIVGVALGGVPVAAEVARLVDAPLEICVVRKLVAAGTLASTFGAVAEGGAVIVDDAEVARPRLTPAAVAETIAHARAEVLRLSGLLRDRPVLDVRGRHAILVDDGVITGETIRAALASLRARGPRRLELALPFGSRKVIEALRAEVDQVVCLDTEPDLRPGTAAIAAHYHDFMRVADAEVAGLLAASQRGAPNAHSRA